MPRWPCPGKPLATTETAEPRTGGLVLSPSIAGGEALTTECVVDAALRLSDEGGIEAVNLRRLAGRLA